MDYTRLYISLLWAQVFESLEEYDDLNVNYEFAFDKKDIQTVSDSDLVKCSNLLKSKGRKASVHAPFLGISYGQVDYAELKESREILKRLIDIGEKLDSRRFIFHLLLPRETEHLEKWILESIETFKILEKENDSEKIFCFENVFEPSTNLFDDIFLNFKMSIPSMG